MADFNLSASMKEGKLYISLSGRVASQNVTDLSNILTSERKNNPNGSVNFDCEKLEYISSAGLRVLLSFNKKEKESIKIINVSPEAYEIFDITGFTEIFNITKKLRDFSNEKNVHMMGISGGVTVYYIGDDILMKVYPEGTQLETIERERQIAQAAFLFEIPTLIAYDIVTYKGQYGMLYELTKASTVFSFLKKSPQKSGQYALEMGKLLKQIHSVNPMIDLISQQSDRYKGYAYSMEKWLTAYEIETLVKVIDANPKADTILYDSFNARNVFIQENGELILINMMGIHYGNPIYDLGKIYMLYRNKSEKLVKQLTGFDPVQAKKFWEAMMLGYFGTNNFSEISKYEKKMEAASLLFSAVFPASYVRTNGIEMPEEFVKFFVEQSRREFFPNVAEIKSLLSE
ncbi:MAG: STAS domain-containing protein [Synergistaceae bacterium]|nr:STAS domain-containing protein [Synergistaceae bacterium]